MSFTFVHHPELASSPTDAALVNTFNPSEDNSSQDAFDSSAAKSDEHENSQHSSEDLNGSSANHPQRRHSGGHKIGPRFSSRLQQPRLSESDTSHLGNTVPAILDEQTPLLAPVSNVEDPASKPDPAAFWKEFRTLFLYSVPVLGAHILEYSLVVTSVVAIGHISTTALAASTLGSLTAGVTGFSILQGLASALDTLLPSAWTSNQPELVGLWSHRMAVVMVFTLIPVYAIWFNAEPLLLLLKQEPEVAYLADQYLRYLSLCLPAYCVDAITRRYFQSQGLFTVQVKIIMVVWPINALLTYLLVWGPEPVRLGFIGAPIATSISTNIIALSSILAGIHYHRRAKMDGSKKVAWHPVGRRSFTNLGVVLSLGLAGIVQTASDWWSWEFIGLAASQLGPVALATQSVLLVSASTTCQAPFALSVAVAVRIGNLLGEKDTIRAKMASDASLLITLIFAAFSSTVFIVFRKKWAYIFNDDPEVVELVAAVLPIAALFQVLDGLALCTGGILRACGKQFIGAILNLSAYYVLGIPFGVWLAFSRHYGLTGLWIGLAVSLAYAAVIGVLICVRTNWDKEVEKVEARLREEGKTGSPDVGGEA